MLPYGNVCSRGNYRHDYGSGDWDGDGSADVAIAAYGAGAPGVVQVGEVRVLYEV